MNSLIARLTQSPVAARVAPFIDFVVLTFGQGFVGETGRCWIYLREDDRRPLDVVARAASRGGDALEGELGGRSGRGGPRSSFGLAWTTG
jgi:hypothetical protein